MSGVLSRPRLIAQERYDLEDFYAGQSAIRTDSKFWTKQFLSGENYIIKGFRVTGIGLKAATVEMAAATLIHSQNTFDFSWFTAEESPTDITISDAALTDGAKNYIELRLVEETNTPATKSFWDPAANGGAGAEFNQEIDTMFDLAVEVDVRLGGFSGDPDRIKLAIVETDGSGNITGILDKRDLFFRLGKAGNVDDEFTWASRQEPVVTLTLSGVVGSYTTGETITFTSGATATVVSGGAGPSITANLFDSDSFTAGDTVTGGSFGATATLSQYQEDFTGADKDIDDFREMFEAITTEIKKLKGTRFWYEDALNSITGVAQFLNSQIVAEVLGAYWRWDGSDLSISQILQPEITNLVARADSAGDLDGTYFLTYDQNGSVGWWIDVDDSGTTAPAGALAADRQVEITTIATNDDISTVASKLQVAINADAQYSASVDNDQLTITDAFNGERQASIDGDSGFTITRVQRGLGNLAPANADVLAKLRLFGELSDLDLTRQDGSGGSSAISIADNQIMYIELPSSGSSRTYSGTGAGNTNFQVVDIDDFVPSDSIYWIAYREGESLYLRGTGQLISGDEVTIGGGVTDDTLSYIGASGPNDANPSYISTEIISQGDNLTLGIGKLDQKVGTLSIAGPQNANAKLVEGGTWSVVDNAGTLELTLDEDAFVQIVGISKARNLISAQTINLPNATSVAYISLLRDEGPPVVRTVLVADNDAIALDDNTFVIARRVDDGVVVGRSFLLKSGEFLELDGALAEINRYFGQFRLIPHESDPKLVRVTGGDVTKLSGSTLNAALVNKLVSFSGAVINMSTGDVFEDDGVTPLDNSFTPAVIASTEYLWYSVTLTAGSVNADNTIGFEVNVIPASSSGVSPQLAEKANFISGVGIGQLYVQEDGGGDIEDILYENIAQLGTIGGAASSAAGGVSIEKDDVLESTDIVTLNFKGAGVEVEIPAAGQADITIDSVSDGRIIEGFRAGEDFDVTGNGAPFAVYPKRKKILEFNTSNNVLETSEGSITIDAGEYVYPYTSLKSQMETKLNLLGALTFTVTLLEQHTKIEADGAFTINKLAANTATTKLGYVGLNTSVPSTFFRADANKDFKIDVLLYKTNTTDDATPPNLASDGVTPVAANWRSRSFSGFVQEDLTALDAAKLYVSGTIKGFSGLSEADNYYINGTAGQVAASSVANSLLIGEALTDGSGLFLDAHNKDFELEIEPDTDFAFDTTDGVFVWEELPEVPNFFESNVALHGAGADGDNVVSAQVSSATLGPMAISYSTDRGKSWKLAQLSVSVNAVNENTINTREVSNWNNTNEYYGCSPKVLIDGNNVFIAYLYWDNANTRHIIRGLYGQIDSNDNLILNQTNEFDALANNIGVPSATFSYTALNLTYKNGITCLSAINTGFGIRFFMSRDFGATFQSNDRDLNFRNGATAADLPVNSFQDFQPYRVVVTDVPGQSPDTATNLVTNGTFDTDISGWTDSSSGTASFTWNAATQSAELDRPGGGGAAAMDQALTTVIGTTYKLSFDITMNSGDAISVRISPDSFSTFIYDAAVIKTINRTIEIVFTATSISTDIRIQTPIDGVNCYIDNVEVVESLENRVSVITPATTGAAGSGLANLFYTDDQDLGNNWATAIDIGSGSPLGAAYYPAIGSYLDEANSLWYVQHVTSHNTNDGSGATPRTGNTDESFVVEIDLSAATPTFQGGLVNWDPNSASPITEDYGEGTSNTNMRSYFPNPKNIYKNDDGVFVTASLSSGDAYLALITDMSDVANSTEVIKYNNYTINNTGGSSIIAEGTFLEVPSGFQFAYKRGFGSYNDSEELGKIVAAALTVDTTAKPELITNGTFDTDISGWTEDQATISFNTNRLRAVSGGSNTATASQTFATTPGKLYNYSVDVFNQVGTANVIFRDVTGQAIEVRSGVTTGTYTGSFRAISDESKIDVGTATINETQDFDNISVQEAAVQATTEIDIIDKPNVDEPGTGAERFAGRIQGAVSQNTAHIFSEKRLPVTEVGTLVENVVYNNFGLKTIELFTDWQSNPVEVFDAQAADTTQFAFKYDPRNPLIGITAIKRSSVNTWSVWTTADGGDSWELHSNFFVSSGQNYDNDNDAYAFQADIDIYDGKFCIAVPVEVGGTHTESRTYYGDIDTIRGKITAIAESTYFSGSTLEDAGAAAGSQLQFQRSPDGSALFVMAFRTSNGNLIINRSDDDGATWSSKGVVKTGASAVAFRYSSGTAYSAHTFHVIEDPDTPNNWRVIVSGTLQAGNARVAIHYTDDQNLANDWETAVNLTDLSAVTVDFITGAELSPNQSKLALTTRSLNASATNTFLTIANVGSTVITLSQDSVNTGVSHGGSDTFNGNNSDNTEGGNFTRNIQRRRIIWEGEDALLYAANGDVNGVGDFQIVKIADVTNIAATASTTRFKAAATLGDYRTTEGQIFKLDNGEYWAVCKACDTTQANWQDQGRIHAKQFFNPNPTVDEPIAIDQGADVSATNDTSSINISNKASAGTPFAGRILAQKLGNDLRVGWEMDNTLGFEGVFMNNRNTRQFNEEVEDWRQVPVQTPTQASDVAVWGFDKSGDDVILAVGRSGASSIEFKASADGGQNWYAASSVNGNLVFANTSTYFSYNPKIKIVGSEACLIYSEASGNAFRAVKFSKTGDVWTTLSNVAIDTFGSDPQYMHLSYDVVNNRLSTLTNASGSSAYYVAHSTDMGANWGSTNASVKSAGSPADISTASAIAIESFDIGSGNSRVAVFGRDNSSSEVKMYYTDDESVTWATETIISTGLGSNVSIYGIKKFGNKVAVLLYDNDSPTSLYITICDDMTAITPTFSAPLDISDGAGDLVLTGGYTASSTSLEYERENLNKIQWISSTSLVCTFSRQSVSYDSVIVVIPDTSAPGTNTLTTAFLADGVSFFNEVAMIKSVSGAIYNVVKQGDSSFTNNTSRGRILAREVYADGSLGVIKDLAYKPDATTGGFAGRIQVAPSDNAAIMFEKEDGSSVEQLYFNSVELRKVQKGE